MATGKTVKVGNQTLPVAQAMKMAAQQHRAGSLQQAEQLLLQIVEAEPAFPPAWHLLGMIAHQTGRLEDAIRHMSEAIKLDPGNPALYINRSELQRQSGQLDQAEADARRALQLDRRSAPALTNLGTILYDRGDLAAARQALMDALKIDKRQPQALNNLGNIARDQNRKREAEDWYRQALKAAPAFAGAANNLGAVLAEQNRPEEAIKLLLGIVKSQPKYAQAHSNLGNAFFAMDDFERGRQAFSNALHLLPGHADAMEGLARCLQQLGQLDQARALADEALRQHPTRVQTHILKADLLSDQGYQDQALQCCEQAIEMDPGLAGGWACKGHLLMQEGQLNEAEAAFLRALELDPENIGARLELARCRKTRPDDDNFSALQQAARETGPSMSANSISLQFVLGKCYDDIGEHDRAFEHYLAGAERKRKRIAYSPEAEAQQVENIRTVFSAEKIQALSGQGNDSSTPIFILGMPRSGTTLTETILASHPDVYGAGELPDLLQLAVPAAGEKGAPYPLNLSDLDATKLAGMADQYVRQLQARNPQAPRITDKMPANFLALGLIHLMLPNARIIHVSRDPVDTCLSAFTKLFKRGQHFSYDLAELGQYYRHYLDIMAHWRTVLPAGSFYELSYEALVTGQEEETRKLVAYCNLDWDDACLTPHRTSRTVKTASITQVRQPVYTSSMARWRRYERHLGPLLDALGDAVTG